MSEQLEYYDEIMFWNSISAKDRDNRINVNFDALLYDASGQKMHISIQNLSIHGIRATSDFPPAVGEAVDIELAGLGLFQGVVRWNYQNKFGVHTLESIDLSVFSAETE